MTYILFGALFFLVLTSFVLLRNRFEFKGLAENTSSLDIKLPFVSICIPARNEEQTIDRCIRSCLNQTYEHFEVLVLNDNSTDGTESILNQLSENDRLSVITGNPKPGDWLGKPWACHQLSQLAKGEILIFLDADVWIEPMVIKNSVYELNKQDALTVWPQQIVESFWEKLVVPTVYFALLTLLPAVYVSRPPKWMPHFFRQIFHTKFVAACGQFFAFKRQAYNEIGGHKKVKEKVVEDMELAKLLKSKNLSLTMMHGVRSVYCKMYNSGVEVWNGFEKNFYAGFGNVFEFLFMGIVHFVVFILPFVLFFIVENSFEYFFLLYLIILIPILQRIFLSLWMKWNPFYGFLHVFAVLWFQLLAIKSITNKVFGIKANWKGRKV